MFKIKCCYKCSLQNQHGTKLNSSNSKLLDCGGMLGLFGFSKTFCDAINVNLYQMWSCWFYNGYMATIHSGAGASIEKK